MPGINRVASPKLFSASPKKTAYGVADVQRMAISRCARRISLSNGWAMATVQCDFMVIDTGNIAAADAAYARSSVHVCAAKTAAPRRKSGWRSKTAAHHSVSRMIAAVLPRCPV